MLLIEPLLIQITISSILIKLLTLNNIKTHNDVLTKEKIAGIWTEHIGGITGGLSALFMKYNCIKPDTTVRTAAQVTAHATHLINRTGTLLNYAWGEDGLSPSYQQYDQDRAFSLYSKTNQQEEYINEETEL